VSALLPRHLGERPGRRVALAAAALLAACAADPLLPPSVRWGLDECTHCHMTLGEERFAAVARSEAGAEARFDDLGCVARFLGETSSGERWQVWAHDARGTGWLPAESAWYSQNPGLATPMGSGLRAWRSRESAVEAGGEVLSWGELPASAAASRGS
jgi:copper chaperone NosL